VGVSHTGSGVRFIRDLSSVGGRHSRRSGAPACGSNIEAKPYGISRWSREHQTSGGSNDIAGDVGVDVKYEVTPSVTADLTYNTDFAQVEVDEQQVNLTRFSLQFPEKREFFLEGRGIFDFGRAPTTSAGGASDVPIVFFSRRIGLEEGLVIPILGGGRLTGKAGKFGIGMLNIQTGHDSRSSAPSTNFTVLRLKRDVLRRSNVGAVFTNRSTAASGVGANQAAGVDAAFSLGQDLYVSGYAARTQTPGKSGRNASYQARLDYAADRYGVQLDHVLVGSNFTPEVGFLRRSDFRRTFPSLRFSPRPKGLKAVRKFT
jgi:hypothetical protein